MHKLVTLYQSSAANGFALRIHFRWDSLACIVGAWSYLCNGNITCTFFAPADAESAPGQIARLRSVIVRNPVMQGDSPDIRSAPEESAFHAVD